MGPGVKFSVRDKNLERLVVVKHAAPPHNLAVRQIVGVRSAIAFGCRSAFDRILAPCGRSLRPDGADRGRRIFGRRTWV
jgi:hypothetical protein